MKPSHSVTYFLSLFLSLSFSFSLSFSLSLSLSPFLFISLSFSLSGQEKIRAYFRSWRPTVVRLFGGTICSSIVCSACTKVTQVVEEFMDLSVPIRVAPSGKHTLKSAAGGIARKVTKKERKRAEAAKKKRDKEAKKQKRAGKKAARAPLAETENVYDAIKATTSVSSLASSATGQVLEMLPCLPGHGAAVRDMQGAESESAAPRRWGREWSRVRCGLAKACLSDPKHLCE